MTTKHVHTKYYKVTGVAILLLMLFLTFTSYARVSAYMKPKPSRHSKANCPITITFEGKIYSSRRGLVKYQFVHKDIRRRNVNRSRIRRVYFRKAGKRTFRFKRRFYYHHRGWAKINFYSPYIKRTGKVYFTVNCLNRKSRKKNRQRRRKIIISRKTTRASAKAAAKKPNKNVSKKVSTAPDKAKTTDTKPDEKEKSKASAPVKKEAIQKETPKTADAEKKTAKPEVKPEDKQPKKSTASTTASSGAAVKDELAEANKSEKKNKPDANKEKAKEEKSAKSESSKTATQTKTRITGYRYKHKCLRANSKISIVGTSFNATKKIELVLKSKEGLNYLQRLTGSDTRIDSEIPPTIKINPKLKYTIGLQRKNSLEWVSNQFALPPPCQSKK